MPKNRSGGSESHGKGRERPPRLSAPTNQIAEVPLTDEEHRVIGEAILSTDERGDLVMNATLASEPAPSTPVDLGSTQMSESAPEEIEVKRGSWLDRLVNRSYEDRFLQALVDQGWTLQAWLASDESSYGWRAFPPGVSPGGRPYVLLPGTIEPGRAVANLVAALRRAGSFDWEG